MDEEDGVAPNLQQATEGLEEALETCQKIVSDYRFVLLNLNGPSEALHDDSPPA